MRLDVVLTPQSLWRNALKGSLCAVTDVLRATTSIIAALASGAAEVRPCIDAEDARRRASSLLSGSRLLCGEEMGQRVPGFDLGNSPLEYLSSDAVSGKIIFLSTTNGTPAIRSAHAASDLPVYIGALLNVSTVSSAISRTAVVCSVDRVVILCAGQHSGPSAEDVFCAGLIVGEVASDLHQTGIIPHLSDSASIAAGFAAANVERAFDVLSTSEHGRYLQSMGFAADIEFACKFDEYGVVPVFDGNRITSTGSLE